jgi:CheY-like chemotaxis protein
MLWTSSSEGANQGRGRGLLASLSGKGVSSPSRRVLIVEDNIDSGRSLKYYLQDVGHEVEHAINGYAAVVIARKQQPDVVILDLGLPGMDGFDVVAQLKREPGLERIRIIVVTGYAQEEFRERTRQAGCEIHLLKPVDPRDIAKLLN